MKRESSASWRKDNDEKAFDSAEWEFKSHQFSSSAEFLVKSFDDQIDSLTLESMMFLPTAEFLISFAIELICKAYYLEKKLGPREQIYRHDVLTLLADIELSNENIELLSHAQRYVIWAGRYPTPKWTKEAFKEDSDVPSVITGNTEKINAEDIPNSSSKPKIEKLIKLYKHIQELWHEAKNA